jgi:hypothetical protein
MSSRSPRLGSSFLVFFVSAFLFVSAGSGELPVITLMTNAIEQGGVIQGIIISANQPSYSMILVDEEGNTWASVDTFMYNKMLSFVIPVPCNTPAGNYHVKGYAEDGMHFFESELIQIQEFAFPSEEIYLDRAVTNLIRTQNPQREQEANALWAILNTVDHEAVYYGGAMRIPVDNYRLTGTFGDQRVFRYSDGTSSESRHWGVDLAAPTGTPVYASAAGRIVFAAERLITGNTIIIEHLPGVFTLFYHMDELEISVGEMVCLGQRVGTVGSTGFSTGAHLHWEMRVSAVPVNPQLWVHTEFIQLDIPIEYR